MSTDSSKEKAIMRKNNIQELKNSRHLPLVPWEMLMIPSTRFSQLRKPYHDLLAIMKQHPRTKKSQHLLVIPWEMLMIPSTRISQLHKLYHDLLVIMTDKEERSIFKLFPNQDSKEVEKVDLSGKQRISTATKLSIISLFLLKTHIKIQELHSYKEA